MDAQNDTRNSHRLKSGIFYISDWGVNSARRIRHLRTKNTFYKKGVALISKIPESTTMEPENLSETAWRFIHHFGEMGSRWGISRTVGQIYALLYISHVPLNADDIAHLLSFSRSNVSMGIKELQSWRLLRSEYRAGDRREYFKTPEDVWEIFRALADERRRREVEPTLSILRECLLDPKTTPEDEHFHKRMQDMYDLISMSNEWFIDIQKLSAEDLTSLMHLGAHAQKLLHAKNRLLSLAGVGKDHASGDA
jgi:DNA-binding transcriptional regulator GbsR (MarR family)